MDRSFYRQPHVCEVGYDISTLIDRFRSSFETAAGTISGLMNSTEEEFLHLGERLDKIASDSREISTKATDIVSRMYGSELLDAVKKLQSIHSILVSRSHLNLGSDGLARLLKPFEEIPRHLDSLARTIRILEMTGFLVKIENARIDTSEAGFNTVASNIQSLGREIREKAEELRDSSASISDSLAENLQVILNNQQQHSHYSRQVLDRILVSLNRLQEKHNASAATLQEISDRFKTISEGIGGIIVSLQFHDITRQRIEHCLTVLKKLNATLSDRKEDKTVCDSADLCRLQATQLRRAAQDFEEAVGRIRRSLKDLVEGEQAISMQTLKLAELTSDESESFLGNIDQEMKSLEASLAKYGEIEEERSSVLASMPQILGKVSGFATDINRMGIEMKFVAMNASINAARIGAQGVSLGVLAINTQELAQQTFADMKSISDVLDGVLESARGLSAGTTVAADGNLQSTGFKNELGRIRDSLHSIDDHARGSLLCIRNLGDELKTNVAHAIEDLQSPDSLVSELENLAGNLGGFAEQMEPALPKGEERTHHSSLEDLESSYTMQSERDVLRSHLEGAVTCETRSDQIGSSCELGDNVDLF